MVTEIAVNQYRLTEGKSGKQADCNEYNKDDKDPEWCNQRKHEPVGHLQMIMQWEDDSYQSVIAESNQIKSLHREAGVAEKKESQAVVVGDVAMVKQKDVKKFRHQGRATKQVHEC